MLRHIILWKLKDTVEDKEGTKRLSELSTGLRS